MTVAALLWEAALFNPGYECHSPIAPSDFDRLISGYRLIGGPFPNVLSDHTREALTTIRAGPAKRVGSVFNRGCTALFMTVFHKKLTPCSTDIYDHDSYGYFLFLFFFGRVMPDEGFSRFVLFVKK